MEKLAKFSLCDLLFGCNHSKTTRPFQDDAGSYIRCLECGARIVYDLPEVIKTGDTQI